MDVYERLTFFANSFLGADGEWRGASHCHLCTIAFAHSNDRHCMAHAASAAHPGMVPVPLILNFRVMIVAPSEVISRRHWG
jgi:sugar/nucleoside kinase (ribokinase family)